MFNVRTRHATIVTLAHVAVLYLDRLDFAAEPDGAERLRMIEAAGTRDRLRPGPGPIALERVAGRSPCAQPSAEDLLRDAGLNLGTAARQPAPAQWAEAGIEAKVTFIEQQQLVRLTMLGAFDAQVVVAFASIDPDLQWPFFVNARSGSTGRP